MIAAGALEGPEKSFVLVTLDFRLSAPQSLGIGERVRIRTRLMFRERESRYPE